jgi:hypothetical protein
MKRNQNRFAEILAFAVAVAMIGYMAAKAFAGQVGVDVPAGGQLLLSFAIHARHAALKKNINSCAFKTNPLSSCWTSHR